MKENSVNHAMNSIFSIDDFSDSFLSSSPSPPPATVPAQFHAFSMSRCQSSEWVDKFLEEVTGNPSAIASLSVRDHTIPGVVDPSVVSRSSVSSAEGIGNDDVGEIKKPSHDQPFASPVNPCSSDPVDSDEYRAYLKSKLDLACAAVALRAPPVNPEDKSSLIDSKKQAAKASELRSQASVNVSAAADIVVIQHKANVSAAADIVVTQHKANGRLLAKPANQSKSGAQVRQSTSGSSRDDSDEDELDGDTETTVGFDQLDEKRARRMLSNRESARRSRRRKQAHLTDLETQAGQLRVEHSSLLKGLTEMSQKYDEASVNNRILKADIETLRVKVKMAEETVKRETGLNPLLLPRPDVPSVVMPLVNNPMDASTNAAVPMLPNSTQFFHNQVPSIRTVTPHHGRLDGGVPGNPKLPAVGVGNPRSDSEGENMTETSTLQHIVGLDQVPQQIGHRDGPSRAVPSWDSGLPRAGAKNNK